MHSGGGTFDGRVVINLDNDAEAGDASSGSLRIGTSSGNYLSIDGNEIVASSGGSAGTLFLQFNGGTLRIGGGGSVSTELTGNFYASGAITALSDMRDKMVVENITDMNLENIANAPVFTYHWKDKKVDSDLHIGSSAQYWKTVMPEAVLMAKDEKGTLSMQYGVAALVSSIIIARKVANHEVRIGKMEKWMKKWAEENDE